MSQVAIIAGAAAETAAAVAIALAENGFDLALLDADESACAATAKRVAELDRRALVVGTDLADAASVTAAVEQVCGGLADPVALVNIVHAPAPGPLGALSDTAWTDAVGAPLRAVFVACRAVLDVMTRGGGGRIVTVADTGGAETENATVRTGLEGLTRTLALELAPFGITANLVAPKPPVAELGARTTGIPCDSGFSSAAALAAVMLTRAGTAAVTGQVLRLTPA